MTLVSLIFNYHFLDASSTHLMFWGFFLNRGCMTFPITDCAFVGDVRGNRPTEAKQMPLPIGRGDVLFMVQSIPRLKANGHGQ